MNQLALGICLGALGALGIPALVVWYLIHHSVAYDPKGLIIDVRAEDAK
jgi:hypothetical protein